MTTSAADADNRLLDVNGLSVGFADEKGPPVPVTSDVSFSVSPDAARA
jgi:ABC-type glutathione transport system ATPase component